MSITIVKNQKTANQITALVKEKTGADLSVCLQCKKCTNGCPVGKLVDCPPSEIMRRLHLHPGKEILESDILWTCVSCETCSGRCPMGIEVASVMDALRQIAAEQGASKQKGNVPLFNKAFLATVKIFGRTYEMAMIAAYKLGTGKFMDDTEKFPSMLKKRKIALLPSWKGDRKTVRRIFDKTRKQNKGAK